MKLALRRKVFLANATGAFSPEFQTAVLYCLSVSSLRLRAKQAGLREGDALIGINGQSINSVDDLHRMMLTIKTDTESVVTLIRHSELISIPVTPVLK